MKLDRSSSVKNPSVSVIIPTFNRKDSLIIAINSVLNQTYPVLEILVIDNNSDDETVDLIKSLGEKKIRIFINSNLGIIANSRNVGIEHARGDLIFFLDSDDFWHKKKIELALPFFKNFSVVCHEVSLRKSALSNDWRLKLPVRFTPIVRERLWLMEQKIILSSAGVSRDALGVAGSFREDKRLVGAEDFDLWLRIFAKPEIEGVILREPLGFYDKANSGVAVRLRTLRFCLFMNSKAYLAEHRLNRSAVLMANVVLSKLLVYGHCNRRYVWSTFARLILEKNISWVMRLLISLILKR